MENKIRFDEFNLSTEVQKAVKDMGFEEMSPIQAQSIPLLMEGKDLIGQAQTGTGKTAAFGIPILESIDPNSNKIQALILCPTRELSIQVSQEITKLSKYKKKIKILPVYGGQPIQRQLKALRQGVQIVVGTPGRVIDHIKRKTIRTDSIKTMILDEADEMFDMGFRDDIKLVMDTLAEDRQTVFFSATMAKNIINFASRYQKNPEMVKVVPKEMTVPKVEQGYYEIKPHAKTELLSRLIDIYNPKLALVFCNTKRKVDDLTGVLQGRGYFVDALHGDLKQSQRDAVMDKFRKGTIDILIATDVAARGIDVDDVDLVVNYDMPQDNEYYVHRIGRTARAGREGIALSFVSGREIYKVKDIQRYTKTKMKKMDIPSLKDMQDRHIDKIKNVIQEELDKKDYKKYELIINNLIAEENDLIDIASVLLKLHMGQNKYQGHDELANMDKSTSKAKRKSGDRAGMARLYINVGKTKGISQRHIVASIHQYANLSKENVGNIDIYDKFSFVEVPKKYRDRVLQGLNGEKVKGVRVQVEIANPKRK